MAAQPQMTPELRLVPPAPRIDDPQLNETTVRLIKQMIDGHRANIAGNTAEPAVAPWLRAILCDALEAANQGDAQTMVKVVHFVWTLGYLDDPQRPDRRHFFNLM